MIGWHFSSADRRLRYGDGRQIRAGITHKVDCAPVCCRQGLHASRHILSALNYGNGPYIWRVEVTGQLHKQQDKFCGQQREYLWGYNAEVVLRDFARRCALDVIHLWGSHDAALNDVALRFLKTGDVSLRDAVRDAARAAQNRRLTSMIVARRL